MRCWLPALLVAAACAPGVPRPAVARALPCVDVAVHPLRSADPGAFVRVVYELSNRCDRGVPIDFTAATADAVLADGRRVQLQANAIDGSVPQAVLDTGDRAAEVILYGVLAHDGRGLAGVVDASSELANAETVCVDVSRLAATTSTAPICMRRADDDWVVVAAIDPQGARNAAVIDASATVHALDPADDDRNLWRHTDTGLTYSVQRFAPWQQRAPLAARFGMSLHHLALADRGFAGAARMAPGTPIDQLDSFDGDIGGYLGRLYLGAELEYAPAVGEVLGAGGVVGAALPRLAGLGSQLEIFGGSAASGWMIEPRLRAIAWITPHLALEPWAGYGMGPPGGEWSIGLAASAHLRSFD